MAFNFNWSPLMADTSRARDMLTTALNKSPKPPIIVDDIIVTELNLGSTPPELEILEVGDLAEDRFRGIFKMSYTGDAFLTLKTRVQANPLNTYLSAKPSFASPQPLAAASGLTIPLQITLSDIRLSGFVILVFSRQKGLTLVFRNDPLESLKVSSTFDSIPFVRDYLQKEIEGQLRVLFMEDLPAILHRLSLRLWSPEYQEMDDEQAADSSKDTTTPIDPLASPPQDAVDAFGNPLDESQISSLSLDPSETHASFSQKNLLRLAALTESHRTLSLFTPSMREAVFRAWAGAAERDHSGTNTPSLTLSSLSRIQSSFNASVKSNTSSIASGSTGNETTSSRPTLQSFGSTGLGAGRSRTHPSRKKKNRVVNLRRDKADSDSASVSTEPSADTPSIIISDTTSIIPKEEEDIPSPPRSPTKGLRFHSRNGSLDVGEPSQILEQGISESAIPTAPKLADAPKSSRSKSKDKVSMPDISEKPKAVTSPTSKPPSTPMRYPHPTRMLRSLSLDKIPFPQNASSITSNSRLPMSPPYAESASSGGILEQAWMMKMAAEIARKVQEEKDKEAKMERESASNRSWKSKRQSNKPEGLWERSEDEEAEAPPAYVA